MTLSVVLRHPVMVPPSSSLSLSLSGSNLAGVGGHHCRCWCCCCHCHCGHCCCCCHLLLSSWHLGPLAVSVAHCFHPTSSCLWQRLGGAVRALHCHHYCCACSHSPWFHPSCYSPCEQRLAAVVNMPSTALSRYSSIRM